MTDKKPTVTKRTEYWIHQKLPEGGWDNWYPVKTLMCARDEVRGWKADTVRIVRIRITEERQVVK
jgi:hypothetical protein